MRRERSVEILNGLIEVNNDRIGCYKSAVAVTDETDLRSLFDQLKTCGMICKEQLISQVLILGGEPIIDSKEDELKEVMLEVTGGDNDIILGTCEYGEDQAAGKYYVTLRDHLREITTQQQGLVNAQFALIRANLTKLNDTKIWRNHHVQKRKIIGSQTDLLNAPIPFYRNPIA